MMATSIVKQRETLFVSFITPGKVFNVRRFARFFTMEPIPE